MKDAKDDFRLWDRIHGRDVLKHLEQVSKWEPGKKERERRERTAALEAKQVGNITWYLLGILLKSYLLKYEIRYVQY